MGSDRQGFRTDRTRSRRALCLHDKLPASYANGPGRRAVIWVQGCSIGCPGCFNPKTHPTDRGEWVNIDDLAGWILHLSDSIEGITLSGGEPLDQLPAVLELLEGVKSRASLTVLLFTGYAWADVLRMPRADDLMGCLDVVLAGPYDQSQSLTDGFQGSSNQTLHFLTDRYGPDDLSKVPPGEAIISADGQVVLSGVHPPELGSEAIREGA